MDLPEKQLDPRDKLFLERGGGGSIPVFIRKHIAICDSPGGGGADPCPHPVCIRPIVLRRRDTKESICLLRHITTEKSDLCQYAVCITQNTTLRK